MLQQRGVDNRCDAANVWYSGFMKKDPFVSVRIKKSVRTKARKLAEELSSHSGTHVKLHEAFDHKFSN
jgi:hypothetical protein